MKRKKNLEEITVHELNRIGLKLLNDLVALDDNELLIKDENDDLKKFKDMYIGKIKRFKEFVSETNSYKPDHIVKYFINKKGDLSYTRKKRLKLGFKTK